MAPRRFGILPAVMAGVLVLSPLALTACEDKGPAERAGEKIDEGARDTQRAIEDATD